YFCRAGGNRPDGLNEPVTFLVDTPTALIFWGSPSKALYGSYCLENVSLLVLCFMRSLPV
ncbi:hypothetical protein, partial [Escherichia coli]|uniref:hypothetical protein n=1 Tax=Escherichia coli TaxID=562 RepID=UPI001BD02294